MTRCNSEDFEHSSALDDEDGERKVVKREKPPTSTRLVVEQSDGTESSREKKSWARVRISTGFGVINNQVGGEEVINSLPRGVSG